MDAGTTVTVYLLGFVPVLEGGVVQNVRMVQLNIIAVHVCTSIDKIGFDQ